MPKKLTPGPVQVAERGYAFQAEGEKWLVERSESEETLEQHPHSSQGPGPGEEARRAEPRKGFVLPVETDQVQSYSDHEVEKLSTASFDETTSLDQDSDYIVAGDGAGAGAEAPNHGRVNHGLPDQQDVKISLPCATAQRNVPASPPLLTPVRRAKKDTPAGSKDHPIEIDSDDDEDASLLVPLPGSSPDHPVILDDSDESDGE